jgi:membrane-bound lytic murein transglycosylase D
LDIAGIAKFTGSSAQEMLDLNPTFKLGMVPDIDQPVTIYMPKKAAGIFVNNEDSLQYALFQSTPATKPVVTETASATTAGTKTVTSPRIHTVKRGESLGTIANKYKLTVTELKRMNGLRGTMIHAGQKLKVGKVTKEVTAQVVPTRADPTEQYIYYEVQAGDTLWNIAERHPGITVDDLKRMNTDLDNGGLQPGRKIKVGVQQG